MTANRAHPPTAGNEPVNFTLAERVSAYGFIRRILVQFEFGTWTSRTRSNMTTKRHRGYHDGQDPGFLNCAKVWPMFCALGLPKSGGPYIEDE